MSSNPSGQLPAPLTPVATGRCFVCLCDQEPAEEWVKPCPCTLEGHQDCMMSWIAELERENKPFQCPICKSDIILDEPFDPAVALGNRIYKAFNAVSPSLLGAGVAMGLCVSLTAYGNTALWFFAGTEGRIRFLIERSRRGGAALNLIHFASLPWIAPALVVSQTVPALGNLIFLPASSLYAAFNVARDEDFLSWPPSPGLVFATFPWFRAFYRNMWREFVRPLEMKLDRRIAGLPEPEPHQDGEQHRGGDNANGEDGGGGIVGLLDAAINLLDIPEVDLNVEIQEEIMMPEDEQGLPIELEMEMRFLDALDPEDRVHHDHEGMLRQHEDENENEGPDTRDDEHADNTRADDAAPAPVILPAPALAPAIPAPAPAPAQPAEPRQWNVHATLRDIGNSLAAAFLLPAIAGGAGELLRLALPARLTMPAHGMFRGDRRPGLLQEMWGRSLVGGCLYLVLRDAFKLYTKYRRAVNMPMRKVRSLDRKKGRTP